jgi:hypothetical protein
MAYDKVVDSTWLENIFKAIGNAIRGKTGNTAQIPIEQLSTEIDNIPTGGGGITDIIYIELEDETMGFGMLDNIGGILVKTIIDDVGVIPFPGVTYIGGTTNTGVIVYFIGAMYEYTLTNKRTQKTYTLSSHGGKYYNVIQFSEGDIVAGDTLVLSSVYVD